jgi:glycosyltransferase involved in cell wall biosynthesis
VFLAGLKSHLIPVPFGSSDWVNHRVFFPTEEPKTFDAVYVANYAPLKRVHVLFRALRQITRGGSPFRAALVCSSWGGKRDVVHQLIDYYGVGENLTVFEDLERDEVNSVLNLSKCNLLLSLKEGSNRSLFEAMFAGTPVMLLDENTGVNRDYINEETGMVVPEVGLSEGLQRMAGTFERYRPREWAMENISPEVTTRKLARVLQDANSGNRNFDDLLVKTNDPEAVYFDPGLGLDGPAIARRVLGAFRPGQVDAAGGLERMDWLNGILSPSDQS